MGICTLGYDLSHKNPKVKGRKAKKRCPKRKIPP
jgi:hypothetical protein